VLHAVWYYHLSFEMSQVSGLLQLVCLVTFALTPVPGIIPKPWAF
jgi:hypothetical protein